MEQAAWVYAWSQQMQRRNGETKCEWWERSERGEKEAREHWESIERGERELCQWKNITKLWIFDLSSFAIAIDIDGNFLFQTCPFITFVARGHFSPLLLTVAVANAAYDEHQAWNRYCRRPWHEPRHKIFAKSTQQNSIFIVWWIFVKFENRRCKNRLVGGFVGKRDNVVAASATVESTRPVLMKLQWKEYHYDRLAFLITMVEFSLCLDVRVERSTWQIK